MAEDRERLIVEALILGGRRDDALSRAEVYLRRFPSGLHRDAPVERLARELAAH